MSKFHLSANGPAICKASERSCPVGGEHFNSEREAGEAFEKNMRSENNIFSVKTKNNGKKLIAIGGALLSTVSLAACNNSDVMAKANAQMTEASASAPSSSNSTPSSNVTMRNDEIIPSGASSNDSSTSQSSKAAGSLIQDKINEKVNEYTGKAKSAKSDLDALKKALNGKDISGAIGSALNSGSSSSSSSNFGSTSANTNSDQVLFQGKSLKVSKEDVARAQSQLKGITVAPEYHNFTYNREAQFGKGFKNGVMARTERRDLPNATFPSNSRNARADGGYFYDAYSGQKIQIVKGSKVDNDLDHVEALKEIEESGAWAWSQEKRVEYANNIDNLAEVSYHENRSKGDGDIVDYTPSYEPAQCSYVVAQIRIKSNYHLSMDNAEYAKTQQILNTKCSN